MAITYNEELKVFKLDTANSSYIFEIYKNNSLLHIYYGGYIPETTGNDFFFRTSFASVSPSDGDNFSPDVNMFEISGNSTGDFRLSTAEIKNIQGNTATDIKYVSHKIYPGKPEILGLPSVYLNETNEADTLEVLCRDSLTQVEFTLYYTVFNKLDVITRSVKITNNGQNPVIIEKAHSLCCDFPENNFDLIHLYGKWAKECSMQRLPVMHGIQSIASKRGASSSFHNPSVCLARTDTTETHGECFGFNLLYSGNYSIDTEADSYGGTRITMGINPIDFEWKLDVGESFYTPEAVAVYSNNGIGEMSRTFHRLYRNNIIRGEWKSKKRPLLLNSWEGCFFDFDEEKIYKLACDAKDLGIELLVMDDGWFGNRNDDTTSLGDWFVNEKKLKGGLPKLVKRINDLGLKFGIWFEPEMISPESELYKKHPDWCVHIDGRNRTLARNQLVIDMTRKEVRDNIFEQMTKVLDSCNIEYVKWDFNRNLTEAASAALPPERQHEFFHRFVLGTYELMGRITEKYPHILLENCASGGGRFDGGMLCYSPQIWCSDNTDPIERLSIQYGTSLCYPPSAMGAHVSENKRTEYDTKAVVAMWGTFGYELDTERLSDETKNLIKKQIEQYHKYYDTVHYGDLYRLISPYDNGFYCAWEFVSEDKSTALLSAVTMRSKESQTLIVRLQGLCGSSYYKCELNGKIYSGAYLMNAGLNLSENGLNKDGSSISVYFEKV